MKSVQLDRLSKIDSTTFIAVYTFEICDKTLKRNGNSDYLLVLQHFVS